MSQETELTALAQAIGADIKSLNTNKVSVVAGKGLSTNDYTTVEKTKLGTTLAPGYDNLLVNAASTGTVTLNVSSTTVFNLTLTGNTTIAFSGVPTPTNQSYSWLVRVTMGGTTRTLTWPTVTWYTPGGIPPDPPAIGKVVEYIFSTENGTTIFGGKGRYT